MNPKGSIRVHEIVNQKGDQITEVVYVYDEYQDNGKMRQHHVTVKRDEFERVAVTVQKPRLSFDNFIQVVRPLLMGPDAEKYIPEAFHLLDVDQSGTIEIGEFAAYMPVIVPGSNSYMLLRHFQEADTNKDYKLNFEEFTAFINKGVVRDLALGRL